MNDRKQEERLDYLLREFKEDSVRYRDLEVGEDYAEKRMALRSLINKPMTGEMAHDVFPVQDELHTEKTK